MQFKFNSEILQQNLLKGKLNDDKLICLFSLLMLGNLEILNFKYIHWTVSLSTPCNHQLQRNKTLSDINIKFSSRFLQIKIWKSWFVYGWVCQLNKFCWSANCPRSYLAEMIILLYWTFSSNLTVMWVRPLTTLSQLKMFTSAGQEAALVDVSSFIFSRSTLLFLCRVSLFEPVGSITIKHFCLYELVLYCSFKDVIASVSSGC